MSTTTATLSKKAQREQDRDHARELLRAAFPKGSTISTVVRNSPAASLAPQAERSASGTGSRGAAPSPSVEVTVIRGSDAGASIRTAPAMAAMCSGVVPQHPPTKRTPLRIIRAA